VVAAEEAALGQVASGNVVIQRGDDRVDEFAETVAVCIAFHTSTIRL